MLKINDMPIYDEDWLHNTDKLRTELKYSQTLYVPLNIRYPELFKDCDDRGISYEEYHITRVFTFYANSESDIRYIRTKHILKTL